MLRIFRNYRAPINSELCPILPKGSCVLKGRNASLPAGLQNAAVYPRLDIDGWTAFLLLPFQCYQF